eukprot:GILI01004729.1.p1 GENE.GILI01004729.1~~GILI01004729.1.p1  ORF type:complete len:409 (+),score=71.12 GILI01004729.1:148-1374(+)
MSTSQTSPSSPKQFGGISFTVDPRYTPFEILGQGASGIVAAARDSKRKRSESMPYELVAIKKISKLTNNALYATRILREIKLLRHFAKFPHENILNLRDIMIHTSPENASEFQEMYVVTDLMEADLHSVIKINDSITEEHIQYLGHQILKGIWYLHAADVVHRDLKPQNLLVNSNCDLKICDFGLARSTHLVHERTSSFVDRLSEYVVTRFYRAPELLLESRTYGKPVDIWSAGCILLELFLKRVFIKGANTLDQLNKLFEIFGTPDEDALRFIDNSTAVRYVQGLGPIKRKPLRSFLPPSVSDAAVDLLEHMLDLNPSKRYTAEQCLQHPYFVNYYRPEDLCEPPAVFDMTYERRLGPVNVKKKGATTFGDEQLVALVKRMLFEEYQAFLLSNSAPISPNVLRTKPH